MFDDSISEFFEKWKLVRSPGMTVHCFDQLWRSCCVTCVREPALSLISGGRQQHWQLIQDYFVRFTWELTHFLSVLIFPMWPRATPVFPREKIESCPIAVLVVIVKMTFEVDTQPIVEQSSENGLQVRVYHKRWYILAVFSILGILQVSNTTHKTLIYD